MLVTRKCASLIELSKYKLYCQLVDILKTLGRKEWRAGFVSYLVHTYVD